jgi:hypothetical protein
MSPIDRLILEAVSSRKQPATCVRLLQAAAKFGVAPQVDRFFELFVLTADKHEAIRDAACRVICRLRLGEDYPTGDEPHARASSLSLIA